MSNAELLLKKVEGLSPEYMATIFDFIDQLKHKAPPAKKIPTASRYDRFLEMESAIDPRLIGAVNPAVYGKGKICGDIIGPFHEEWENALDEGEGIW
ncbi:hypothetical protein FACS1894124_4370 [Spirochaetia bacterium]|nr:hypothetical protein FACS1894124_4370 [Spirochaetia bacterium]